MQLPLSLSLQDDATFSNYIGEKNLECVEFLKQMTNQYYERSVYIWGRAGLGKSHLLQAVCNQSALAKVTAIYLPLNEMVQTSPEILVGLEQYRLVCLDDIEAIAGKKAWEEAVFHLYNRMLESKTSLIVTSQYPLTQTPLKLSDLISRLNWGITFKLKALTDDEKMKLLQLKAKAKGLELSSSVSGYLIRHYSRETSDLFTILNKLDHASLVEQRKITIPFIKETLETN